MKEQNSTNQSTKLLEDFQFVGGESIVARMSRLHPDHPDHPFSNEDSSYRNPIPVNGTVEYLEGEVEGKIRLGAVATKWLKPDLDADRQMINIFESSAGGRYADLYQAEHFFGGSNERLGAIVSALGLGFEKESNKDKTQIKAILPGPADDINDRLKLLGITDREFVDFDSGRFGSREFMRLLADHKLPIAKDGPDAIHDRAFHLVGHVLMSPTLLDFLATKAKTVLSEFEKAERVIGGRPFYEFDGDEPSKYYHSKKALGDLMGKIDFNVPSISFVLSRQDSDETRMLDHYLSELGVESDQQRGNIVTETLEWLDTLNTRAENLNS